MVGVYKNKKVIVLIRDFRYGYAKIKNLDYSGVSMYVPISEVYIEE